MRGRSRRFMCLLIESLIEWDRAGDMSDYLVALDVYEGPLDVLLRLIEREELDITLVSLALVADQFLEHVSRLKEVSAANLADFLVIAARLLVIKSRVLLPQPESEPEQDSDDWEEDLAERLSEYKRYKDAAAELRAMEEAGRRSYPRIAPPPKIEPRLMPGAARPMELLEAFCQILATHPALAPVDEVVAPLVVRMADCIQRIQSLLHRFRRLRFSALVRQTHSKLELIVTFLAMLELIKQQRLCAEQETTFGEIYLMARQPSPEALSEPIDLSEYGEEG
jgi:segregation and condensation protein A